MSTALLLIVFGLLWAVVNAMIAGQKNRSSLGAFLASLVVTPLLVFLYLIAVPAIPEQGTRGTVRTARDRKNERVGFVIILGLILLILLVCKLTR